MLNFIVWLSATLPLLLLSVIIVIMLSMKRCYTYISDVSIHPNCILFISNIYFQTNVKDTHCYQKRIHSCSNLRPSNILSNKFVEIWKFPPFNFLILAFWDRKVSSFQNISCVFYKSYKSKNPNVMAKWNWKSNLKNFIILNIRWTSVFPRFWKNMIWNLLQNIWVRPNCNYIFIILWLWNSLNISPLCSLHS